MRHDDTICAPATIPGAGAISVIRVSGPEALTYADRLIQPLGKSAAEAGEPGAFTSARGYTIRFGTISDENGAPVDEVLVSIFKAPHSYTGENSVEISCHASTFIVSEILRLLNSLGCRNAEPGEFTRRAFLNGKMDLSQAEAVADVIASTSAYSHKVAFSQLKGGISKELASIREQLLHLM
ncbi:MAG: tRNA uridine-5-carboxymethylaminomethyl(34) synthesis GTPase MnmE, partial [Candidatus Cryptobacteroides sp.]